jgi:hypothetical protein
MGQEVSVSYQAVKSKVYKLIDALVEDAKTEGDVQESMKRWWKLIHPADRPVARKYLLSVLAKSNASLQWHLAFFSSFLSTVNPKGTSCIQRCLAVGGFAFDFDRLGRPYPSFARHFRRVAFRVCPSCEPLPLTYL